MAGDVLDRLRARFSLSPRCVDAMERRLEGLQLCFFTPGEKLWYPLCTASAGDCIGQLQSPEPIHLSHVSFQPPIGGHVLRPVVCLCRYGEPERIRPALVHELLHLLSSHWQWQPPQDVCLYSGVARYVYRCSDDGTALYCTGVEEVHLNERITDYLTGQILDEPRTAAAPLPRHLSALPAEQIARAYFEHRGEELLHAAYHDSI